MSTVTSTMELCDQCSAAPAAVDCIMKTGHLFFCMHDFKQLMKSKKFQDSLITSAAITR